MAFKDTVLTLIKIHSVQSPSSELQQTICSTIHGTWTCLYQKKSKRQIVLYLNKISFLPLVGKSWILSNMIVSFFFVFYQIFK